MIIIIITDSSLCRYLYEKAIRKYIALFGTRLIRIVTAVGVYEITNKNNNPSPRRGREKKTKKKTAVFVNTRARTTRLAHGAKNTRNDAAPGLLSEFTFRLDVIIITWRVPE